jgi:antirestriction protein ArdC
MRDVHKEITERILEQLRQAVAPWRQRWSQRSDGAPRNAITGRPYSGVNVLLLWARNDAMGWADPRFLTFNQAKEAGGTVRKGEHGTWIIYVGAAKKKQPEVHEDGDELAPRSFLKTYVVFNIAQCDGLPERVTSPLERRKVNRDERDGLIDSFIAATGAMVIHEGEGAFYQPRFDRIVMPPFAAFHSSHFYYATLFHELVHWTGAASRLNRDLSHRFGDRRIVVEELIAELGASFVCAEFGVDNVPEGAVYVESFITLLEDHETALVSAASAASRAVEYLRELVLAEATAPQPTAAARAGARNENVAFAAGPA